VSTRSGTPSLGWNLLQAIRKGDARAGPLQRGQPLPRRSHLRPAGLQDHASSLIVAQERATEYREDEETSGERAEQRLDQAPRGIGAVGLTPRRASYRRTSPSRSKRHCIWAANALS